MEKISHFRSVILILITNTHETFIIPFLRRFTHFHFDFYFIQFCAVVSAFAAHSFHTNFSYSFFSSTFPFCLTFFIFSQGLFSRITFREPVFLGGTGNITGLAKRLPVTDGMLGCIRKFVANEHEYIYATQPNGDITQGFDVRKYRKKLNARKEKTENIFAFFLLCNHKILCIISFWEFAERTRRRENENKRKYSTATKTFLERHQPTVRKREKKTEKKEEMKENFEWI